MNKYIKIINKQTWGKCLQKKNKVKIGRKKSEDGRKLSKTDKNVYKLESNTHPPRPLKRNYIGYIFTHLNKNVCMYGYFLPPKKKTAT